jgi:hypothetical protein
VQVYQESYGFLWYTEPATFVSQLVAEHATVSVVTWLHDHIDQVLAVRAEPIARAGGLLLVHDWRAMQGYDKEARLLFSERMKRRRPGYSRGAVVCVPDTPLLRMAVQGTNLLAAFQVRTRVELVTDVTATLARHRVKMPEESEFPA